MTTHPTARRSVAGLGVAALATTAMVVLGGSAPAYAAPTPVTGATFTWDFNNEATSGAFQPGAWNLMSAGKIGSPGAGGNTLVAATNGATWSNSQSPANWSARSGNVVVEDLRADGTYTAATFADTRTNSAGANASTNGVRGETRLSFGAGTGTLDPVADNASITWDGEATLLFYSGLTYFTVSDPELTVTGGAGRVTATVGGYATDMNDSTRWTPLPDTEVTLATLSGVDVTDSGLITTPAYAGVAYTAPSGAVAQSTTSATFGAFPQDFVAFQQRVGQGSYWYSSGGAADVRKVANPLSVTSRPTVSVSDTDVLPDGQHVVTLTGAGFDPAGVTGTRPPLTGRSGGVYVAFGRYADAWRSSAGAPAAARRNVQTRWAVSAADMATIGGAAAGAIELTPAGTFATTLILDKAAADAVAATGNYGIYTYPGGGASNAAYETATPITFTPAPAPVPAPAVAAPVAQVVQVATRTRARLTTRPTATRPGVARVEVPGVSSGKVALTLKSASGRKVKGVGRTARIRDGVAKVRLPRMARGTYRLVVTFRATPEAAASKKVLKVTVS